MFASSAMRETGRLAGVALATAATGLLVAALPTAVGGSASPVSAAAATPAPVVQQIDLVSAPLLTAKLPQLSTQRGVELTLPAPLAAGGLGLVAQQ